MMGYNQQPIDANMNGTLTTNNNIYTYHLPYPVRRDICNLLDADQSWRTLGGQFMALDATRLKLIEQACLRNSSPTEELLNKLDSGNVRIIDFCYYLEQMNHHRALEILKPYLVLKCHRQEANATSAKPQQTTTLCTPTPSFNDIRPAALMSPSEFDILAKTENFDNNPKEWSFLSKNSAKIENNQQQQQQQDPPSKESQDPGEEIVRLACSSNRKRTSITDQDVVNQLRLIMQISYNELKQASDDFSERNILGNGGFASVYRGHWKGTDVAIKRLRCNLMDQAFNELTILNSYRIDNILPIYGISIDGPEACLVYQFMANGSLEDRLSCKNGSAPLTWEQRAMIGEGVAKGLFYLHTLRNKPLVHGDAKSANVLLDSQFIPKLGDFGLARQVFRTKNLQTEHCTSCTVSAIHGTSVYLPPEYLRHKILSPAVDVYSYGIVLLEMATGRRAYDGKKLLIDLVEDEIARVRQRGAQNLEQQLPVNLIDARLNAIEQQTSMSGRASADIWQLLLHLGLECAHSIKKRRPDMGQVLNNFAQFKSLGAPMTNQLFDGASYFNQTPATTRTLTPDLTEQTSFRQQQQQQHQQHHSSNLMSVDEEEDWNQLQQVNEKETMIPLLTELGFVAGDESCQEANQSQDN